MPCMNTSLTPTTAGFLHPKPRWAEARCPHVMHECIFPPSLPPQTPKLDELRPDALMPCMSTSFFPCYPLPAPQPRWAEARHTCAMCEPILLYYLGRREAEIERISGRQTPPPRIGPATSPRATLLPQDTQLPPGLVQLALQPGTLLLAVPQPCLQGCRFLRPLLAELPAAAQLLLQQPVLPLQQCQLCGTRFLACSCCRLSRGRLGTAAGWLLRTLLQLQLEQRVLLAHHRLRGGGQGVGRGT